MATERMPPRVRAVRKGHVTSMLDSIAEAYREANPDKDCRWVYAPEDRADYSKVLQRRVLGYATVGLDELSDSVVEEIFAKSGGNVRVGDQLLMGIDAEHRKEMLTEADEDAKDAVLRVKRQYYEQMEGISVTSKTGTEHRGVPIGSITQQTEFKRLKIPGEEEE